MYRIRPFSYVSSFFYPGLLCVDILINLCHDDNNFPFCYLTDGSVPRCHSWAMGYMFESDV